MRILPGVIAMAIIVVASNILVQFLLLDGLLTWGAFTYPFAFLVTDIMNRVYGAAAAVILAGFGVGIVCSLVGSQIMLEGDGYSYAAVAFRVAIASATAFLAAQLLDVAVFNRFRDGSWWRAPLVSTVISSAVDTVIFFSIAFSAGLAGVFSAAANDEVAWAWDAAPFLTTGPDAPLWVSLAVADWGVKLAIAIVALVPFRIAVGRMIQPKA
jgi:queuosine precursor transporter